MSRTTEAAVLYQTGQPLRLIELTLPALKPGQLIVEVAYSGVCGSQLLEARGRRGLDRFLPHTMGHEGSGTVVEVGEGVTKVRPGDRVVLSWIRGSGAEVPSTVYTSADGPVNSGAITTFQRLTVTCENRVTPLLERMPLREAALLGCAVPTGCGVILNTLKVEPGSSVAIFGVGGIGLTAVLAADMTGAAKIIAVDLKVHKLEQAQRLGATHLINAAQDDPFQRILEITDGMGVDYSVEAAGNSGAMMTAFRSVRDNSGVCVLAGNVAAGQKICIDPFDLIRGKRIVGTWGGESIPERDFTRYAELFISGKLHLERLITHTYPLRDVNRALDDLEDGKVGRALIEMR